MKIKFQHQNEKLNDSVLYIIGNGFDIAHKLPTTYEDFHKWLIENGHGYFVQAFESLYPDVKDCKGRWCDIEKALGSITLNSAVNFDLNYQYLSDEKLNQNSSLDEYTCGRNINNVVKVLPGLLLGWVKSIQLDNCPSIFEFVEKSRFLSFNYTRTLENIYGITEDKVLHIHEMVMENRPLVVGYGHSIFENDEYDTPNDNIDINLIIKLLSQCKKPVEAILREPKPKTWFENLREVSSVTVFGHSCSIVDKPYFETVAKSIQKDAYWHFYVHDRSNNIAIETFAKSIMKDQQCFEIINQ